MGKKRFAVLGAGLAAALLVGGGNAAAAPDAGPDRVWTADRQSSLTAQQEGASFTPVAPVRVLDTRTGLGTGGAIGKVGPGGIVTVDLSDRVPATATAVYLNVTGTEPTASTFVTVYPAGTDRPLASNLNLVPGQTRPNAVTVGVLGDRRVTLFNNVGSTHLIADLTGYYATDGAARFNPTSPQRVLDTRSGQPVGPAGTVSVNLAGLPATATAVTFNLTGVDATANTFVTAFPSGTARPLASNLNLVPGEVAPNQVTVPLGADRRVTLYNNAGRTHLVVDLAGYYATDRGLVFHPIIPERILDTRTDPGGPLGPGETACLLGIPETDQAWVFNLTGTNPTAPTFVTAWPGGQPRPLASNLNLVGGQTAPNLVTIGVGAEPNPPCNVAKSLLLYNNNGNVDLILDLSGFFETAPA